MANPSTSSELAKLFVGQIPTSMTEEHLKPIFDVFGTVVNIQIIRDRNTGAHKASAFVSYGSAAEAQIAIDNLHNLHVIPPMTTPLQVKFAHVAEPNHGHGHGPNGIKMFVGSLPREMPKEEVEKIFNQFGGVEDVHIFTEKSSGQSKGAAFVYMKDQKSAEDAIEALHNKHTVAPMNRPLQVSYAEGELERLQAKLFVGTLPTTVTKTDLTDAFAPYGEIVEVYLMKQSSQSKERCAFLRFADRSQAEAALAMNGQFAFKDCQQPIVVRFADTEKEKLRRREQKAMQLQQGDAAQGDDPVWNPQYSTFPKSSSAGGEGGSTAAGAKPTEGTAGTAVALPPSSSGPPNEDGEGATGGGDSADGSALLPPPPRQQYGPQGANVFIFHLPQSFTEEDLRGLFQQHGKIISCRLFLDRVTGRSKCFGFVSYEAAESANSAIQALNGYQVGNYRLKVQLKASDLPEGSTQPYGKPQPSSQQLRAGGPPMPQQSQSGHLGSPSAGGPPGHMGGFPPQQHQPGMPQQQSGYGGNADPSWYGYGGGGAGGMAQPSTQSGGWYPNTGYGAQAQAPNPGGSGGMMMGPTGSTQGAEQWYGNYGTNTAAALAASAYGNPMLQQQQQGLMAGTTPSPTAGQQPTLAGGMLGQPPGQAGDLGQYNDLLSMLATTMSAPTLPPSLADWYAYADALSAFSNSLRAATAAAAALQQQQLLQQLQLQQQLLQQQAAQAQQHLQPQSQPPPGGLGGMAAPIGAPGTTPPLSGASIPSPPGPPGAMLPASMGPTPGATTNASAAVGGGLPETPPLAPTDPAILPVEPPPTTAPGHPTPTYTDSVTAASGGARGYPAPVEGDWL